MIKQKWKPIISSIIAAVVFVCHPVCSLAGETNNNNETNTITIEANLDNPEEYAEEVEYYLSSPDIDEVIVLDTTEGTSTTFEDIDTETSISSVTTYTYRISNVQNAGTWTGSNIIAIAEGTPGITISISTTKSVENTYSTNVSVNLVNKITAAVGYSVTGSTSVTVSGSAKVPGTHNGKKVKTMRLNAKAIYQKKTFRIDRHKSVGGINHGWTNGWGSGNSSKPVGVSFSKTFTYK